MLLLTAALVWVFFGRCFISLSLSARAFHSVAFGVCLVCAETISLTASPCIVAFGKLFNYYDSVVIDFLDTLALATSRGNTARILPRKLSLLNHKCFCSQLRSFEFSSAVIQTCYYITEYRFRCLPYLGRNYFAYSLAPHCRLRHFILLLSIERFSCVNFTR